MNTEPGRLEKLGFDEWFRDNQALPEPADISIARVVSVNKNNFIVSDGTSEIFAELAGRFIYGTDSPLDFPAVGDWVGIRLFNDDTFAVIFDVLQRKTLLKRKTAGSKIEYQLIASNIDAAIVIQALDSNYNLRRLERYLVMINEGGIKPLIFLSKSDLISPEEIEKKKREILQAFPGIDILSFSNQHASDIETIKAILTPGKTFCLLGSSGVGKTTLINNLINEDLFKTQAIREKDGRGRHTTSRRDLIILNNGAIIIDNPGMRELGVISAESGFDETFNEVTELSKQCRFSDCTHTVEKGCAVLSALEEGALSRERYDNYMKMHKESLYHEMSYVEKRQKDKKFGKYVRSILKYKNDKK
ncbi:MAG: ribosome small subunit-dependent GTPase A [Acidobacteriota bacterium]